MMQALPYWRLSGFYLFHFAILGIIVPYWGLMLQGRGFDAQSIGELTAILLLAKIIAPNVWGWLCVRAYLLADGGSDAGLWLFLECQPAPV